MELIATLGSYRVYISKSSREIREALRDYEIMSKANIISREKSEDGKSVRVTFRTHDGREPVYEYRGASMRAILRGKDPAGLTGGRRVGNSGNR
jgi:hypothetical protein